MINIEIPMPEKISANKVHAGVHWGVRKRWADTYHKSFLPFKNKYKINEYPIKMTLMFEYRTHALDIDNNFYMAKLCIDSLRSIGLLRDDTLEYVSEISIRSKKGLNDVIKIKIS